MSDHVPTLAVVVVNYATADLLQQNLVRVAEQLPDALVVVVDNLHSHLERERASCLSRDHGWVFVAAPGNLGFGGGMNLGVSAALDAGADQVMLLTPDAAIDAVSVSILQGIVEREPMTLASPLVVRPDGSVWFDGND